jgi:hypothetical protein
MLKQNGTIFAQYPFRLTGGGSISGARQMWGRTERNNIFTAVQSRAAVPNGHLAPSAWILPRVAGGMSSRNEATAAISVTGNAAQGINLVGNSVLTITVNGSAAAVAAAVGSASMSINVTGNAVAPLNASGSASMSITASAQTGAIAHVTGSATAAVTASLVTGAIGHMVSQPIDQSLTVDAIAIGVWNASAAANNIAGTMGEKLNDAGSAGNPWASLLADNNTPDTFGWALQRVKTKTDSLTFTISGTLDSNIKYVNDTGVQGTGTEADPWNPV